MDMLLPIIIAIILTLANSTNFLKGILATRVGEVYLGTTHYYEDYFLYLNQFFQGSRGGWLTLNRFTSEPTPPSILFWPNILLGKLGGLLGLSPEISYNLSVMLLSFAVLLVIASLMRHAFPKDKAKALIGFLFAALATSLMNHIIVGGNPMWYPFQLWKTPNFALDRLGGVPHQLVQTLLFVLAMYVWFFFRPKRVPAFLVLLIVLMLLTSLNPVMSALFLGALWATQIVTLSQQKTSWITLFVISIGVALTAWQYNGLSNLEPHIRSKLWEAGQQITTTPLFMLLSVGPISFLGMIGAISILKRARPVELFSVILIAACYSLYFSPIPKIAGISNSRVLFPGMYAAWGILGVLGLEFLASQLHKYISSIKISYLAICLSAVFLILSLPTLRWELEQKLVVKPEERTPLLYLPSDVYQAFVYVRNQGSFDDIVLGNPASHMDALLPALTGHTGFTGHPFATIDNERKKNSVIKLYQLKMTGSEAKEWLITNQIRFILFTKFDGDIKRFWLNFPFLKVGYANAEATVLSIP